MDEALPLFKIQRALTACSLCHTLSRQWELLVLGDALTVTLSFEVTDAGMDHLGFGFAVVW